MSPSLIFLMLRSSGTYTNSTFQVLRAHKKDQVIEMEALFGESDCKMRGVPVRQIDFRNCAVRQGAERAVSSFIHSFIERIELIYQSKLSRSFVSSLTILVVGVELKCGRSVTSIPMKDSKMELLPFVVLVV